MFPQVVQKHKLGECLLSR